MANESVGCALEHLGVDAGGSGSVAANHLEVGGLGLIVNCLKGAEAKTEQHHSSETQTHRERDPCIQVPRAFLNLLPPGTTKHRLSVLAEEPGANIVTARVSSQDGVATIRDFTCVASHHGNESTHRATVDEYDRDALCSSGFWTGQDAGEHHSIFRCVRIDELFLVRLAQGHTPFGNPSIANRGCALECSTSRFRLSSTGSLCRLR